MEVMGTLTPSKAEIDAAISVVEWFARQCRNEKEENGPPSHEAGDWPDSRSEVPYENEAAAVRTARALTHLMVVGR